MKPQKPPESASLVTVAWTTGCAARSSMARHGQAGQGCATMSRPCAAAAEPLLLQFNRPPARRPTTSRKPSSIRCSQKTWPSWCVTVRRPNSNWIKAGQLVADWTMLSRASCRMPTRINRRFDKLGSRRPRGRLAVPAGRRGRGCGRPDRPDVSAPSTGDQHRPAAANPPPALQHVAPKLPPWFAAPAAHGHRRNPGCGNTPDQPGARPGALGCAGAARAQGCAVPDRAAGGGGGHARRHAGHHQRGRCRGPGCVVDDGRAA